jgi:heterodisulfide reductase subunit A-like polyferredoxin
MSARRSEDAAIAALTTASRGSAAVDAEKCAICLTCIRECPHGAPAITWNEEHEKDLAYIQPEACAGCGVCVTLCPAQAITFADYPDEPILTALEGANAG